MASDERTPVEEGACRPQANFHDVKRVEDDALTPVERLMIAFELHEFGVEIMRQNLRREHPQASDARIESLLLQWLYESPSVLDPELRRVQRFD